MATVAARRAYAGIAASCRQEALELTVHCINFWSVPLTPTATLEAVSLRQKSAVALLLIGTKPCTSLSQLLTQRIEAGLEEGSLRAQLLNAGDALHGPQHLVQDRRLSPRRFCRMPRTSSEQVSDRRSHVHCRLVARHVPENVRLRACLHSVLHCMCMRARAFVMITPRGQACGANCNRFAVRFGSAGQRPRG